MKLTTNEKRGLAKALGIILKKTNSPYTNTSTIYKYLEYSNTLNIDEINNIMHYVTEAKPQDLYDILNKYFIKPAKYRKERKEIAKQKQKEYYQKNKAKIAEKKRMYQRRYYESKKGKKKDEFGYLIKSKYNKGT